MWSASACPVACTPKSAGWQQQQAEHLVVEKPIDVTLTAADTLIAAAQTAGILVTVISQHRFAPDLQELRGLLDRGELGRLVLGEASTKWSRSQGYYDSAGLARHLGPGRRLADEPGHPLSRPALLVDGTGRRSDRAVRDAGARHRGRRHHHGHPQVPVRGSRLGGVQHRDHAWVRPATRGSTAPAARSSSRTAASYSAISPPTVEAPPQAPPPSNAVARSARTWTRPGNSR